MDTHTAFFDQLRNYILKENKKLTSFDISGLTYVQIEQILGIEIAKIPQSYFAFLKIFGNSSNCEIFAGVDLTLESLEFNCIPNFNNNHHIIIGERLDICYYIENTFEDPIVYYYNAELNKSTGKTFTVFILDLIVSTLQAVRLHKITLEVLKKGGSILQVRELEIHDKAIWESFLQKYQRELILDINYITREWRLFYSSLNTIGIYDELEYPYL